MKAWLLGVAALAALALTVPAFAHCYEGHVTAQNDGGTDAPPPPPPANS